MEVWWEKMKTPLRLTFEAREGEWGGGQDHNLRLFVKINFFDNERLTCSPPTNF